jgi:ribosomal-protein-serine acetyltransferase
MLTHRLDDRRQLRLTEVADAEELNEAVEANRAYLARWMPWAGGQTLENTRAFIQTSRSDYAADRGINLVIVEDQRIVGTVGCHRVDPENRSASLGYWIAEAAQGRGTVTIAARALLDHVFGHRKLNRVDIHAGVENRRSRAVAERLGFQFEGVLREFERNGDRFVDHAVYSMLAREWRAQ